jgi:hypothetical protein
MSGKIIEYMVLLHLGASIEKTWSNRRHYYILVEHACLWLTTLVQAYISQHCDPSKTHNFATGQKLTTSSHASFRCTETSQELFLPPKVKSRTTLTRSDLEISCLSLVSLKMAAFSCHCWSVLPWVAGWQVDLRVWNSDETCRHEKSSQTDTYRVASKACYTCKHCKH